MEIRITLIQNHTRCTPQESLSHIDALMGTVKEETDLVVLPEICLTAYLAKEFVRHAQPEGGEFHQAFARLAKKHKVWLIAGTVAEQEGNKIYNTSFVFNSEGKQVTKHRKMHLFDVDIKGIRRFFESDSLTAGDQVTVFDTPFGRIGLCVCYDIRFPELSRLMADKGAEIIIAPGAFNQKTGPLHWELEYRSRALSNQVYTIGVAPATQPETGYSSWGHSIVCDPWGRVILQMSHEECVETVTLDLSEVSAVREQLPLLEHRRLDLYELKEKNV